ncbi:hypothetical protein [Rhizobium sp. Root708]|uniref:hypothetical protein n=1 Tax=Rhizobium sp. Root708 TaxID=1736592 RepID=UPI000AB22C3F|nr:hypothetical protein [Rhizobium sp. Root708]
MVTTNCKNQAIFSGGVGPALLCDRGVIGRAEGYGTAMLRRLPAASLLLSSFKTIRASA